MIGITRYLRSAVQAGASDVFFSARAPVSIRVDGRLQPLQEEPISAEEIEQMAGDAMTPMQKTALESNLEADFASHAGGVGRFRVNVFRQRGQLAMVWRHIKDRVPGIDELKLPASIKELSMAGRGLILVAGPTGSGKSSTLAAMIDHRNQCSNGHILTIEDPIEFWYTNKRSIINQREIGLDTRSYSNALISALRESPDVIMLGEIRDRESMSAALQLASTGHLVMSTVHANNAYQSLQRILSLFPEEMHTQIFMDLALNLRAIISQRLVRARDGGRLPSVEMLMNTPLIGDLILNGHIGELQDAMTDSSMPGMQTFDDSLFSLCQTQSIEIEEALEHADSRSNLEARINFGG